jgi:tetratricopeptide (TPR) repeat protein
MKQAVSVCRIVTITAVALSLTAAAGAQAHEYTASLRLHQDAEVARAIAAKLASDPANADALIAKTELILNEGNESRLDEAVKLAEQCIAAHQQNAECQLAYGNALGTKAMTAGIWSAMSYAGKIRDAFQKAVELDPKNWDARGSLMQYYLQAPGVVGGGLGKAQSLASESGKLSVAAGTLLHAYIDLDQDQAAKAEADILAVNTSGSDMLADMQRDLLVNLGFHYMKNKKYGDAERAFLAVQQRFPVSEMGSYGLGRNLQEQGKNKEAIPQFEKALAVVPRSHIHYRLGQCWQALNDKAKATGSYEKALAGKPELQKKQKSDAEQQLKALKT